MGRISIRRRIPGDAFVRSQRGVTPVIAIILLLMMTVAAAGSAYLWITKISKTIRASAEKNIMNSFRTGKIEVISSYGCEENCTKDTQASGGARGECSEEPGALQMLNADRSGFYEGDEIGSEGRTRGSAVDVVAKVERHVCLLMRNTGGTVLRITDLGTSQFTYELPNAPEKGVRPLLSRDVATLFSIDDEKVACRISDMGALGSCGSNKKSLDAGETFVLSFYGTFKDAQDRRRRFTYTDAKDQRIIIGLTLPSGSRISHQVV